MLTLSVVICTYERPGCVIDLLGDLRPQLPDGADVVIVDQSGPEARERLLQAVDALADRRITCASRGEPSLPAARNDGLAATTGEIVLFLDDDVRLLDGCVAAHVAAFADPRVGGVVGRIVERTLRPNARRTVNRLDLAGRVRTNLEGRRPTLVEALKGANMSFRRAALQAAGGFDPAYGGTALLEDADASEKVARLGWDLRFVPEAAVVHLSAPRGGVRTGDARTTEWWRFRNTGYFLRRHRGLAAVVPATAVFGAIAAKRAAAWRDPRAVARLMGALAAGWRAGRADDAPVRS